MKKFLFIFVAFGLVYSGTKTDTVKATKAFLGEYLTPGSVVGVGAGGKLRDTVISVVDSSKSISPFTRNGKHAGILYTIPTLLSATLTIEDTVTVGTAILGCNPNGYGLKSQGKLSVTDTSYFTKSIYNGALTGNRILKSTSGKYISDTLLTRVDSCNVADSAKAAPAQISGLSYGIIPRAASETTLENGSIVDTGLKVFIDKNELIVNYANVMTAHAGSGARLYLLTDSGGAADIMTDYDSCKASICFRTTGTCPNDGCGSDADTKIILRADTTEFGDFHNNGHINALGSISTPNGINAGSARIDDFLRLGNYWRVFRDSTNDSSLSIGYNNNPEKFIFRGNGWLGINDNQLPQYPLHVFGTAKATTLIADYAVESGTVVTDSIQLGSTEYTTGDWIDYYSSSTVIGWGSFTKEELKYIRFGNSVTVEFCIFGVSNASNCSFTLPIKASSPNVYYLCYYTDSTILADVYTMPPLGRAKFQTDSLTVKVYNNYSPTWQDHGTKNISGSFTYMAKK